MKILIQMIGYLRVVLFVAHKLRSPNQYNTFKYDNTIIEKFPEEVKPIKLI